MLVVFTSSRLSRWSSRHAVAVAVAAVQRAVVEADRRSATDNAASYAMLPGRSPSVDLFLGARVQATPVVARGRDRQVGSPTRPSFPQARVASRHRHGEASTSNASEAAMPVSARLPAQLLTGTAGFCQWARSPDKTSFAPVARLCARFTCLAFASNVHRRQRADRTALRGLIGKSRGALVSDPFRPPSIISLTRRGSRVST